MADKSTITPQQNDKGEKIMEQKRKVVFTNGDHLNLRNVTRINHLGTWLRIWSDEGFVILDPKKVLYYIIDGQ
jgi:hypothetical protein